MNESNLVQKFIWFSERAILLTIALATLFASASEIIRIISVGEVNLSDLFLLFIYAEVLGMVASFYANNRIPVTLPLIIAIIIIITLCAPAFVWSVPSRGDKAMLHWECTTMRWKCTR